MLGQPMAGRRGGGKDEGTRPRRQSDENVRQRGGRHRCRDGEGRDLSDKQIEGREAAKMSLEKCDDGPWSERTKKKNERICMCV